MSQIELNKHVRHKACVIFPDIVDSDVRLSAQARLEEACGLALAINLEVVCREIVKLRNIKPATFFAQGFIDKIKAIIAEQKIDLVIVDSKITPIQQRNLEKKLECKVIDRTALILEIFGERAKTKEGSLQVELAHLTYQRSRLVRSWTHLERQRGGAGFLGGPGETQIELDRRIIDDKIVRIKKELQKVKQTRELQRSARKKIPYPVVALVGYTNAGKSTLFNYLSKADVFAKNLLFATLDPTMRRIKLPSGREVILSDTVGFISDLPHELIMSFRATLEEVLEADIVVNVRDIANPDTVEQKKDVLEVLDNLGLKEIEHKENYIEVQNKIDLLPEPEKKTLLSNAERKRNLVPLSAVSGEGCSDFLKLIDEKLSLSHKEISVTVPAADGKLLSWLYRNADVKEETLRDEDLLLNIKIDETALSKLRKKLPDIKL